jgi:prolipoprotein diacylglyceryltransferase
MTPGPWAVTTFAFDPVVQLAGIAVRWQTVALGGAILASLVAAAWSAGRASLPGLARLRGDDLLFLAVATVPGAIVGGRVAHVLAFLDYYRLNPERIADPAHGGLSLLGAVLGGTITAAYMASLLDVPTRRWADAVAVPLLLVVGLGKVALLLGGEGQGRPYEGPWATAFSGPGPWFSAAPGVPAHPAQLYEAAWAVAGIALVLILGSAAVARRLPGWLRQTGSWTAQREARGEEVAPGRPRFGVLFAAALAWFLAGRVVVGFAWRDESVAGVLNAEQVMALVCLAAIACWIGVRALAARVRHRHR